MTLWILVSTLCIRDTSPVGVSTLPSRDLSLLERVEPPTEEVSLMSRVETEFHRVINNYSYYTMMIKMTVQGTMVRSDV